MPAWRRQKHELDLEQAPPPAKHGQWTERLARVGALIDRTGVELRDVAVMTAGGETAVTGLSCHLSAYHGTWDPITYRFAGDRLIPLEFGGPSSNTSELAPSGPQLMHEWERRLSRAGAAVDVLREPVTDVLLMQVDGGMVINIAHHGTSEMPLRTIEIDDSVTVPVVEDRSKGVWL